jgi:hypothetical protein
LILVYFGFVVLTVVLRSRVSISIIATSTREDPWLALVGLVARVPSSGSSTTGAAIATGAERVPTYETASTFRARRDVS